MDKKIRIWTNEHDFVEFDAGVASLTGEIATRNRAIDFYSIGMYLPDPDPVLRREGKDIRVYRALLSDAHVSACLMSRKAGVLSLNWGIDRGKAKSRVSKVIEGVFSTFKMRNIITQILNAPLYGYQPLEVIWVKQGDYILPAQVIAKPPEWFVFSTTDNSLLFRSKQNFMGEAIPDKKFLLPQYNPEYNNPYGDRILSKCFWPVAFKKGGFKFWVVFTEKYGGAWLVGKYPRGLSQDAQSEFLQKLDAMVNDAVAVIPDDSNVEIHEAAGKGASAEIYSKLIDVCNAEISKATLGQTLTTEIGATGGAYAASQTHMTVRDEVVDADRNIVEQTFNQLIDWTCELNFADSERPVFSMWADEDVNKEQADRDKTLTDAGVKFTKQYFMKAYGFEDEDIEEVGAPKSQTAPAPPSFSEADPGAPFHAFPDQKAIDDAVNSISPEEMQAQMNGVLKPIIDMINAGTDYNTILEKLTEAYPNMDTDAIQDMLTRAIFVSELWGRLHANKP